MLEVYGSGRLAFYTTHANNINKNCINRRQCNVACTFWKSNQLEKKNGAMQCGGKKLHCKVHCTWLCFFSRCCKCCSTAFCIDQIFAIIIIILMIEHWRSDWSSKLDLIYNHAWQLNVIYYSNKAEIKVGFCGSIICVFHASFTPKIPSRSYEMQNVACQRRSGRRRWPQSLTT